MRTWVVGSKLPGVGALGTPLRRREAGVVQNLHELCYTWTACRFRGTTHSKVEL
ncbi:hypothetical protein BOTBODRAFT_31169, partial [Botryobasidium botryosum FD-172 SS1]